MDTMLNKLSESLDSQGVIFDPYNQRVRCLAHIINLAAKSALENLCASDYDDAEEDTESNLSNTVYKVSQLLYINI